tara:strand:- start:2441 stop:5740 length:3300 start_codon:yes stop_codon:yes gene_type:complete
MTTDFKIKKEYVSDHMISLASIQDGVATFNKDSSDPMRQYFEVLYGLVNPSPEFVSNVRLMTNGSSGFGGYIAKPTKNNSNEVLKIFQNLKDEVENKIYADFNFKIDENFVKNFSISTETIRRELNSFDIRSSDGFFIGGDLPPQSEKDETSFKFGYAFITTKTEEGVDLIIRDVTVATPDPKELQEDASNKNPLTNKLERLKHILYDGDSTLGIQKLVIGNGGEDNFKLGKAYNILRVVVPKEKEDLKKGYDYYTSFQNIRKAVFDNQFGPPLQPDKLSELYKELSMNYFSRAASGVADGFTFFGPIAQGDLAGSNVYSISDQFIKQFTPDSQAADFFENTYNNEILVSKDSVYVKQQKNITELYSDFNSPFTIVKDSEFLSENQQTLRETNLFYAGYDYTNTLFLPQHDQYSFGAPSSQGGNILNDWTIKEIYRSSLIAGNGKRYFDAGTINNNLLRKAKLIGVSIIKSRKPYDTENPFSEDDVIQTYHINIQQGTEEKLINLFDSQVVYGNRYYYTALGVFAVDGKYYYYDGIEANSQLLEVAKTTGVKVTTIEVEKENIDDSLTKSAISKLSLIGVDASNDKNDAAVYVNPCCQYKDDKFKNVGSTTGVGNSSNPDDEFWGVAAPVWSRPGYAEELETKIEGLVAATKAGSNSEKELSNALKQISGSPYRNGIKCWICRRRPEGSNKESILKYLEDELSSEEIEAVYSFINCKFFGYSNKRGAVKGSKITPASPADASNDEKPDGSPNSARCTILQDQVFKENIQTNVIEESLLDFRFNIRETNARAVYQIPVSSSVESSVIDAIPFAPMPTFFPLSGIDNKIKISFQQAVGSKFTPVSQDDAFRTFNSGQVDSIVKSSKDIAKQFGINLPVDPVTLESSILARSEGDISEIHVRRLDRRPDSLEDLVENGKKFKIDYQKQTSYYSHLKPNQKYYYVFVSRDVAGLYSTATSIYQVEIVNDSGFVYTKIEAYEFPEKTKGEVNKTFKKLLKIKPSFEELQPTGQPALVNFIETIGTQDKWPDDVSIYSKKSVDGSSNTQPPRFKIRVRSKKTNRVFDINLKYSQETKLVTSIEGEKQIKEFSQLIDQKNIAGTDD